MPQEMEEMLAAITGHDDVARQKYERGIGGERTKAAIPKAYLPSKRLRCGDSWATGADDICECSMLSHFLFITTSIYGDP